MERYQVGALFPIEQLCTGKEQYVAIPTTDFFNVMLSLKNISKKERKLFTNGSITAYLFEEHDIPFVIFDFGEGLSFDIAFDISRFDQDTLLSWLSSRGNAISLFLVDADTGILEAIRLIAVGFADEFRTICARQEGQEYTEMKARMIQQAYTTRDMMKHSIAKTEFKR